MDGGRDHGSAGPTAGGDGGRDHSSGPADDAPPASPLGRRSWPRRLLEAFLAAVALAVVGLAVLWLTLPDPLPLATAWPETTAYVELRQRQAREAGRELELRWESVPLSRVPDHVERAVRVSEDAMFYRHPGVDLHEVRASLREWWTDEERLRGASTITMQLARNLHLSPERSYWRKLREVLLALRLESRLTKSRILELYLSVVELGPGVFGVEAAAGHYWGTTVAELDRRQAAELAATLPSPLEDNPRTRTRRFLWRADLIERRAFGGRTPPEAGAPETEGKGRAPFGGDAPPPGGADTAAPVGVDTPRGRLPAPDSVGPGSDPLVPPADTVGAEADSVER